MNIHKPIGEEIHTSGLDTAHRQFSNTTNHTFQDQQMNIQLMRTKSSKMNDANIKLKLQRIILDK